MKYVLAILALIAALALALCSGDSALTAADGTKAGDRIHSVLTDYIAGSDPVAELDGLVRPKVLALVTSNNGKEGVTVFINAACERIITLMQNRIRSTTDATEKRRLREALPIVRQICEDAKSQAQEPSSD